MRADQGQREKWEKWEKLFSPSAGPNSVISPFSPPNHPTGSRVSPARLLPLLPLLPKPMFWMDDDDEFGGAGQEAARLENPPVVSLAVEQGMFVSVVQEQSPGYASPCEAPPAGDLTAWLGEGVPSLPPDIPVPSGSLQRDPTAWLWDGEPSGAPPVVPSGEPTPLTAEDWMRLDAPRIEATSHWGLTEEERAEALARLRLPGPVLQPEFPVEEDDEQVGTIPVVEQSIPHHVMVAGLLKASRTSDPGFGGVIARAREAVAETRNADPWATGVAQLQTMPPLDGFTLNRWDLIKSDCCALLRDWGAEMRRLGWSTEDAFGIHPEAPGDVTGCYGLGVLLNGGNVTEISEKIARIRCQSGAVQTFVRKPMEWAVPIWMVEGKPA